MAIEISKTLALHGPNVWGSCPILEVWVGCQKHRQMAAADLKQAAQRGVELSAPYLAADDFPIDPHAAADVLLARWVEGLTRKLQRLCGIELPAGHIVATAEGAVCRVAVRFEDEGLVRPALKIAHGLLDAALDQTSYDFASELRSLQSWANKLCLGPSTRAIVEAARSRGIPVRRLNVASLVQFGHGAQQRRICTAETDGTGAIAESIAQDKELTKTLLRRVGIPVPEGRPVSSAADAWEAAVEIGTPVVVKPRDANHGRGVAIRLSTREAVMSSYELAAEEGTGVIVEQYVAGVEHRLLVVGSRVVAAARGEPDVVLGDGRMSIRQLVHLANLDPRRGDEFARPMCKIEIDALSETLLEQQGYTPDSIPAAGAKVIMHYNGEYTTDVTDQLHPETASLAVLAARVVGLDVAGIDLVTSDISRPIEARRGMIIEVNAGPGLQMHAEPQIGSPRPVGAAIIETLFPEGQTGRIPIVALAEAPSAAATALATAHLLGSSGWNVGLESSAGTWVGGRFLGAQRGRPTAADLLLNPFVEAAVLEVSATGVYAEGLSFDDCDVAVMLPSESDAAESAEESETWRRILVESISPLGTAIFSADDPRALRLATCCRGEVLWCHASPLHPHLVAKKAAGSKIAFWRDGAIWVSSRDRELPIANSGEATAPAAVVMLAACAAWCAGASVEKIGQALPSLAKVLATGSLQPDRPRAA
jgi:cyanophycin synthetase